MLEPKEVIFQEDQPPFGLQNTRDMHVPETLAVKRQQLYTGLHGELLPLYEKFPHLSTEFDQQFVRDPETTLTMLGLISVALASVDPDALENCYRQADALKNIWKTPYQITLYLMEKECYKLCEEMSKRCIELESGSPDLDLKTSIFDIFDQFGQENDLLLLLKTLREMTLALSTKDSTSLEMYVSREFSDKSYAKTLHQKILRFASLIKQTRENEKTTEVPITKKAIPKAEIFNQKKGGKNKTPLPSPIIDIAQEQENIYTLHYLESCRKLRKQAENLGNAEFETLIEKLILETGVLQNDRQYQALNLETLTIISKAIDDRNLDPIKAQTQKILNLPASLGWQLAGFCLMIAGALVIAAAIPTAIIVTTAATVASFGIAAPLSAGAGVGVGIGIAAAGSLLLGTGTSFFYKSQGSDLGNALSDISSGIENKLPISYNN